MSTSGRILRNVASNWAGFAVNAVVTLLLTPIVLRELGDARYGIWALTSSIIGYYGLLDLGFRGSINQFLTRSIAVRDFRTAGEVMSTAIATLSSVGLLCVFLSFGAAFIAPRIWNFPAGVEDEAFWCILIVGLTSSIQFVFFPFMSVFMATQRFDLMNLIGISTRVLTAGAVYWALKSGYGLIGISAATCGVTLIDYVVRWWVSRRLVPELQLSRKQVSRTRLRELAVFGAWTFMIAINGYIYAHAQPLIIGVMLPIAFVGYYALATGLAMQVNGILRPIGQVMYPAATAMHAQGDKRMLERLYHDGSRLVMLVMICVVLIAGFWAEDFYRLWIGPQHVSGDGRPSIALILQVLLIATATSFVSNIASQILMGAGHVRMLATMLICGSVLNLTLSLILLRTVGLVGAAIATVVASVAIDLIAVPIALQRVAGFRVVDFIRTACLRPLAVAVILAIAFAGLRLAGSASDWPHLLLFGATAGSIAAIVTLAIGVTKEERRRWLFEPLQRLTAAR
jgi:O-antigen/teichoic acid export membrane protein